MDERVGYMDGIDFQEHLEHDSKWQRVYPSVEACLADKPCARECGVVRVRIVADAWPVEQNLYTPAASGNDPERSVG